MIIRKGFRSVFAKLKILQNSLNNLRLFLVYGDVISVGRNYWGLGVNYDLNPHSAKLSIGNNVQIRKNTIFRVGSGGLIILKNGVFINAKCSFNSLSKIEIGENTILGEDVKVYDHNHGYQQKDILIKEQPYLISTVTIGKNCWIGSNVVILKGVNIGDNCIIGASCIIHKNIKENSLVYSNLHLEQKEV